MGAISISEALAIEASAMANGWSEEQLLNAAGEALGHSIANFFPTAGTVVGYLGKGHNAGDALVALRILRDRYGWKIAIRLAYPISQCAPLTIAKWDELGVSQPLDRQPAWREMKRPILLLDGLLGTGTSRSLRDPLAGLASEISHLRHQAGALVASVDLPSGIDPDSGEIMPNSVTADATFMIGNAKAGLLAGHAANATGALVLVAVEPLTSHHPAEREIISPQTFNFGKSPRPFDFHKGMAGRVAIVAGSEKYTGAAVLAACGALRGGAGLVTLWVPPSIRSLISGKCPPEIIVGSFDRAGDVLDSRFDALVLGCGLGEMDEVLSGSIMELLSTCKLPTVLDADALNLIARSGRTDLLAENHLITPHPGEFARLAPDLADLPREMAARRFADSSPATLLLKGSRTIVTRQNEALWINSTGTPGMATGGQGDLLSGVIGARLAAGDPSMHAAALGAWLCGRAAEIAVQDFRFSEESLLPGDLLQCIGAAFRDWKSSTR